MTLRCEPTGISALEGRGNSPRSGPLVPVRTLPYIRTNFPRWAHFYTLQIKAAPKHSDVTFQNTVLLIHTARRT